MGATDWNEINLRWLAEREPVRLPPSSGILNIRLTQRTSWRGHPGYSIAACGPSFATSERSPEGVRNELAVHAGRGVAFLTTRVGRAVRSLDEQVAGMIEHGRESHGGEVVSGPEPSHIGGSPALSYVHAGPLPVGMSKYRCRERLVLHRGWFVLVGILGPFAGADEEWQLAESMVDSWTWAKPNR